MNFTGQLLCIVAPGASVYGGIWHRCQTGKTLLPELVFLCTRDAHGQFDRVFQPHLYF